MFYRVLVKVSGSKGSISLPPKIGSKSVGAALSRPFREAPSGTVLAEYDREARDLYMDAHGVYAEKVDIKVECRNKSYNRD